MSGSGPLHLTDRQAKILAACGLCHRPLEWRGVKAVLEAGDAHPPDIYCGACRVRARGGVPAGAALLAALTVLERIEEAGLLEHYKGVAAAAGFPPKRPAA